MRVLDVGLAAHLAGGATTLATCWILRRRDGAVLGFTDHDLPLVIEDVACAPAHGLEGGEVPARLGAGVDTGEVLGMIHSAAITDADILMGRYDGAVVETWRVNWRAPEQRLRLATAEIGEIVREDGQFRAELRSLTGALNRVGGRVYQPLCDAELGDARCGIDLDLSLWRGEAVVLAGSEASRIAVAGLAGFAEGWFTLGKAMWSDGARQGLGDRVLTHERIGGVDWLGFATPLGEWVAEGDSLVVTAGCDKRFATCRSRFDNGPRFRGFPHIPGSDFVLRYPRAGDALDGRRLVE